MDQETLLGCHVEMVLPKRPLDSADENHKKYISSVDGYKGNHLLLSMPMLRGKFAPVHKGERYDVYVFVSAKIYQCTIVVEGAVKEENHISIVTTVQSDFQKYERREFFRLSYTTDIYYKKVQAELLDIYRQYMKEGKELLEAGFAAGTSVDLSAGGMKFLSEERFQKEDVLVFRFTVNKDTTEEFTYVLLVHVIESTNHPTKMGTFINRVAFEVQNPKARERLVSFIFKEQRKALQRSV